MRRVLSGIIVLLLVVYLSFLAQEFAVRSRWNQPAPLGEVAGSALHQAGRLLSQLPRGELGLYRRPIGLWGSSEGQPLRDLLGDLLLNSAALLALAMALGGVVGGLIGIGAAGVRRRGLSLGLILLSVAGISTPSFFLFLPHCPHLNTRDLNENVLQ